MAQVMNSAYQRNLSMISKKLLGYSRQTLKVMGLSSTTANPGDVIRFQLPNNTIVDLSSLVFFWQGTTTATGTNAYAVFPKNTDISIINKIDVEIGGRILTASCNNWNLLANTIIDLTTGYDKQNNRLILNGSAPLSAAPTADQTAVQFATNNFIGFLSSVHYLNTYLTGAVTVTLYLAPTTILATAGTVTSASYQLTNMFFSVDTIDINDGYFMNLQMAYLSKGGVYEIPYKNWVSFSSAVSGPSQSTNFSLSTQSLNKVSAFFTYGTRNGCDGTADTSTYFTRFAPSGTTHQFTINGIQKPTWQPTSEQSFLLTNNVIGNSHDVYGGSSPLLNSLAAWLASFYCFAIQLDHNDPEFTSGLNTLGNTAASTYTTNGGTTTNQNIIARIYCECTSSLLIGANRQIDVIF